MQTMGVKERKLLKKFLFIYNGKAFIRNFFPNTKKKTEVENRSNKITKDIISTWYNNNVDQSNFGNKYETINLWFMFEYENIYWQTLPICCLFDEKNNEGKE